MRNPEIEATDDPGDDLKGYDMATEEEREQVNNNFRRMALEEYNKGMGGKLWRTHVTEAIEKRDTDKLEQIADQVCAYGLGAFVRALAFGAVSESLLCS